MSPELEFVLSAAGLVLSMLLTWLTFTRTKWATS